MSRLVGGFLVAALALGLGMSSTWAATREFKPGTLAGIKQHHHGQPFLLKLWSVECAPCVKDLDLLVHELKRHPQLKLVLVSVDDGQARRQVDATLHRFGMDRVESWTFGDGNARSLRHEIDPQWYGELPRTYFYDTDHHRVALTGPLKEAHINTWLEALGR